MTPAEKTDERTVLLVDDDVDFLTQMELQLQAAGYRVLTADSVGAAQEVLDEHRPDVAVLDLMMENLDDGFVLAHRIKSGEQPIPVILVTAVTSETGFQFSTDSDEARSWIKADAMLNKPVRLEQLRREIKRLTEE